MVNNFFSSKIIDIEVNIINASLIIYFGTCSIVEYYNTKQNEPLGTVLWLIYIFICPVIEFSQVCLYRSVVMETTLYLLF